MDLVNIYQVPWLLVIDSVLRIIYSSAQCMNISSANFFNSFKPYTMADSWWTMKFNFMTTHSMFLTCLAVCK